MAGGELPCGMLSPRIYPSGDHAITIELGNAIDQGTHHKVISLYKRLQEHRHESMLDIIPSYHTVTVVYDPVAAPYGKMRQRLLDAAQHPTSIEISSRQLRIPVCYDETVAPDISSLADIHRITKQELIALHTGRSYRVYFLGFLPGFAYMGTVDERIATPRKQAPRTAVPAGSVGIAGTQTGIYPQESPGGWQLIGRTPIRMFDASLENPAYLQPGDEVQFYPVSIAEFKKLQQHASEGP